jgi:hypothetical protein
LRCLKCGCLGSSAWVCSWRSKCARLPRRRRGCSFVWRRTRWHYRGCRRRRWTIPSRLVHGRLRCRTDDLSGRSGTAFTEAKLATSTAMLLSIAAPPIGTVQPRVLANRCRGPQRRSTRLARSRTQLCRLHRPSFRKTHRRIPNAQRELQHERHELGDRERTLEAREEPPQRMPRTQGRISDACQESWPAEIGSRATHQR